MLPSRGAARSVSAQELAIVFITMAFGALHDLELPPNDPVNVEYYTAARLCLTKGKFLVHNTLAGVRALVSQSTHRELTAANNGALLLVRVRDGRQLTADSLRRAVTATRRGLSGASPCAQSRL